jgi:hypothetical protein
MPLVAVALTVAQLFDLGTFLAMIGRHGVDAEVNPFVVRLSETLGLPGILLGKAALIVYLVTAVAIIATRKPRLAALLAVAATYAGLVGGISNIVTIGG